MRQRSCPHGADLGEEKVDKDIIISAMEISRAEKGRAKDRAVSILDSTLKRNLCERCHLNRDLKEVRA